MGNGATNGKNGAIMGNGKIYRGNEIGGKLLGN